MGRKSIAGEQNSLDKGTEAQEGSSEEHLVVRAVFPEGTIHGRE